MSDSPNFPAAVAAFSSSVEPQGNMAKWLLRHRVAPVGPEAPQGHAVAQSWWKVMCLTGVDYFSTLSYLPGIAALAAGVLSPLATMLIIALTLLGMLPMYRRVAQESPRGQGSVAMLENLLPFWRGKMLVLVLLGFVATSWIITITLSSADAAVHLVENPYLPNFLEHQEVAITVFFLAVLGGVFLLGFSEAVTVAIPLVAAFLLLNAAVIVVGIVKMLREQILWSRWVDSLTELGDWQDIAGPAFLAFPLLVLGLSGFETGVSMMPLVAASGQTPAQKLQSKISNTRKLLTVAALIMSFYLMATSLVTTVLIPRSAFAQGGEANGRAMAYLAHELLGNGLGSLYDLSSILILWFAGASAMAGLINIVPRYLPGYGMAPEWGRAVRPMVIVYTLLSVIITLLFQADVNAQAGAYATGILAMMVSAAAAVTIAARRKRQRAAAIGFGLVTAVLIYALGENIREKPDGILISFLFIVGTITVSLISRVSRTTELRAERVEFDDLARKFISESLAYDQEINIIANRPHREGDAAGVSTPQEYLAKEIEQRGLNPVPGRADILFLEVSVIDPSDFSQVLSVRGEDFEGHRILKTQSPAVPNAIAAVLLAIQQGANVRPKCYFEWSEGNPVKHLMRYLLLGRGDTAPVVREILRTCAPDPQQRPRIHVGG